jgi:integrase
MLKRGAAPATADRTARVLKAALALAAREDHRITNAAAWRDGLAKLPDSEVARNEVLPDNDIRKLVAAAYGISPAFGLWIELHAVTGARRSQLMRLLVSDLQDDASPRLMMPSSRKGRRKRVDGADHARLSQSAKARGYSPRTGRCADSAAKRINGAASLVRPRRQNSPARS